MARTPALARRTPRSTGADDLCRARRCKIGPRDGGPLLEPWFADHHLGISGDGDAGFPDGESGAAIGSEGITWKKRDAVLSRICEANVKVAVAFTGCHRRGGVERITFECSKFLAKRGHQVHVFAADCDQQEDEIDYHRVAVRPSPSFLKGLRFHRAASRSLSDHDFDVLSTHGCVSPLGGVHWVQSLHAAWLNTSKKFRATGSIPWLKQKLNPLHPILLKLEELHFRERNYSHIIATTLEVQRDLQAFYGVPAEDVTIIPNGYSPNEFSESKRLASREETRRSLGINEDEVVALFVANELDRKGFDTILRAMRLLDHKTVKLLVVSRVPAATVLRRAHNAGVGDRVLACGHTDDVARYHSAADIFVLPTQYEAFCLAILEALASGLPVVTTRVPGAADAIREGINGITISEPRNAEELSSVLRRLLDPDLRASLSSAASPSVAQYQWPLILERYENVLRQFCSRLGR